MQLNMRPNDLFHHPLRGGVYPCADKVLVRLKITRPAAGPAGLGAATSVQLLEVIGPVQRLVRFRRLADFQFDVQVRDEWQGLVPALAGLDSAGIRTCAERMRGPAGADADADGNAGADANARGAGFFYAFSPPAPSQLDFPVSIMGPDMSLGRSRQARPRKGLEPRTRLPWLVSFADAELPRGPSADALAGLPRIEAEVLEAVRLLLERRPVVTRLYVHHETGIAHHELGRVLPAFAYCMVDGPYRNCWVRYGVDPRADRQYRVYQAVQCRNNLAAEGLGGPGAAPPHIFTGQGAGPTFSQFQFCDMPYAPVRRLVESTEGLQSVCGKTDGWYPPGTTRLLRKLMKERWVQLLQAAHPEAYQRTRALAAERRARRQPGAAGAPADGLEGGGGEDGEDDDEQPEDGDGDGSADEYDYYDEE